MSNSVRPHRWQPTRLRRPWDSPGKNTGVVCHFLLQCMKVKSESEVAQSCLTLSDPMDCSLPGSSVRGIFQARILEWGTIAFSERLVFTKEGNCICLSTYTHQFNEFRTKKKTTCKHTYLPHNPYPIPVGFLLLFYCCQDFFLVVLFCFTFVLPSKRQWMLFKIPKIGLQGSQPCHVQPRASHLQPGQVI